MTVDVNRRAVVGAVLAAGAASLSAPARAAIPSPCDGRALALAQCIAGLLRSVRPTRGRWEPRPPGSTCRRRQPNLW